MRDLRAESFESYDELSLHLSELSSEMLIPDDFEPALIGVVQRVGQPIVAVYGYDRCVDLMVERDGMSAETAMEHLDFNTFGGWLGDCTWGSCAFPYEGERESFVYELLDGDPDIILIPCLEAALVGSFTQPCTRTVAMYDLDRSLELIIQRDQVERESALQTLIKLIGEPNEYTPAFLTGMTYAEDGE